MGMKVYTETKSVTSASEVTFTAIDNTADGDGFSFSGTRVRIENTSSTAGDIVYVVLRKGSTATSATNGIPLYPTRVLEIWTQNLEFIPIVRAIAASGKTVSVAVSIFSA